jgi:hypothetical protein
VSEREVVIAIVEWLRMHHEDIAEALMEEVPEAAITLAGKSRSDDGFQPLGINISNQEK